MEAYDVAGIELTEFRAVKLLSDRYEVAHFGESVDKYQDGIVSTGSGWQASNHVYGDVCPFASGNGKWLNETKWFVIGGFDTLTDQTCSAVVFNVPMHVGPNEKTIAQVEGAMVTKMT